MSALPKDERPIDLVLSRLDNVKKVGGGYMASCPVHDDKKASLSIKEGDDGKVLLDDFAGCETEAIVDAIGLEMADLFVADAPRPRVVGSTRRIVATYDYEDDGVLRHQTVRYEPKDFRQRRPDGQGGWIWNLHGVDLLLYRLGALRAADPARTVWMLAGEKDVDRAVADLGIVATAPPLGEGKWRDAYCTDLLGRSVAIIEDNDEPGRKHAAQVAASLHRQGIPVRVVSLPGVPDKGDLSDWLDAGGTIEQLRALPKQSPDWTPTQPDPSPQPQPVADEWPVIDPAAFHGFAGELVAAVDPTTEADPVAVLATFLVAFGNNVGRGPHVNIGDDRHGTNLNIGLVGDTSSGRKGSTEAPVERVMSLVDQKWVEDRKQGGLSTGEGLINAIRDPRFELNKKTQEETMVDAGEPDKRLLCTEEEMSFLIKAASRQGNTLTEIIRKAWDSRTTLRVMTKMSPLRATKPHVSIICHITKSELARNVSETEMANGFLNRYAWFVVRRSKFLAEPRPMDDVTVARLARKIVAAKEFAVRAGELKHDDEARALWAAVYPELAQGAVGLAGAMTARSVPIVRRLSL
ncbi:MAG: hypothetical protein ACR2OO_14330, partial [Thermomicrobiales bacterium]